MNTVSVSEARSNWSKVLERAQRGETIIVTRRGIPVAKFVPPDPVDPEVEQTATSVD